ncbi:MAG: hypothetical protein FWE34_00255 [Defluviitaleaceae bacterium]|nr:hypothetical protein [Defluviitaleaceae bacterium]
MSNPRVAAAPPSDMRAPKKGKAGLVVMLSVIGFLLIVIGLFVFNVFGLRDNVLYPLLRDVPLVGGMIPAAEYDDGEVIASVADLEAEIQATTLENASLEAQLENLSQTVEQLERENERLQEFADAHGQFLADRDALYRDIAMDNPDAFMNFFETMHPQLAEELFISIAIMQYEDERWRNYLNSWINMNPVQVARVIESMLTTDMRLIVDVMTELPAPFRGTILDNLADDSAAAVLRHMEP